METRTQLRATCPHCFAAQAITKHGRLVNHGYTRPQHWHSNEGTCRGAGAPHYGTEAGRDYTAQLADTLDKQAAHADATAAEVVAGTSPVMTTKRLATRLVMQVVKEDATAQDRVRYAAQLNATAAQLRLGANELRIKVAQWQPLAPVAIEVEVSSGPLVHWRGGYWAKHGGRKACAGSLRAALACYSATDDVTKVTCEKCKKVAAAKAAA